MNITEKILASHCGRTSVEPGEFINVQVDLVLANDITAPLAIKEFNRLGVTSVFDPAKVVFVPDHFTPNKDIPSAEQCKEVREFSMRQGLIYFEVGRVGIEHVLLPEQGLVVPGEVVVGADSHTCTYGALSAFATGMGSTDIAVAMATGEIWMKVPPTIKFVYSGKLQSWVGGKDLILYTIGQIGVDGALYSAMEFTGEAIDSLSMDGRFTMANMAIEAGAKTGIFYFDQKTKAYVVEHANRSYKVYEPDTDVLYSNIFTYDVSNIEPQVAMPSLPSNVRPVGSIGHIDLDQVVIGSCTNGRLEDMKVAAEVLGHNPIHKKIRCILIPGTREVYLQAMREGIIEQFVRAGAVVSTPTCGPCLGGHMGILAKGEKCISTTNRNFTGRMGSPGSEIYLAGPAVAAASAVLGRIGSPEEVIG